MLACLTSKIITCNLTNIVYAQPQNPIVPFTSFGHVRKSEYATVLVVPTKNNGTDQYGGHRLTFMDELGETRMVPVCTKPAAYVVYILSRFQKHIHIM